MHDHVHTLPSQSKDSRTNGNDEEYRTDYENSALNRCPKPTLHCTLQFFDLLGSSITIEEYKCLDLSLFKSDTISNIIVISNLSVSPIAITMYYFYRLTKLRNYAR